MPPTQLKQVERLAKQENRTISELIREALRQYQERRAAPVNHDLIAALREVQSSAERAGLDKMNQRQINAEIAAYRRERAKPIKHPVK
jgi:Arc/MetJ-type ribon-helix-helix transcriptional regulator